MTTRTISRCRCGRRKSRYSSECNHCATERRDKAVTEARAIVASRRCPECGAGLRRNLALPGWWQCEQYGAEGFRKDSEKPSCPFQCFTE